MSNDKRCYRLGERRVGGEDGEPSSEEPEGRVLIYWGCSDTVAKGQPEIIDFKAMGKSMSPEVAAMVRQAQARKGAAPRWQANRCRRARCGGRRAMRTSRASLPMLPP